MKTREALVSNSSSSSYFFRVKELKFQDFVDTMTANYWNEYFNKSVLIQEIKDGIAEVKKSYLKRTKKNSKNGLGKWFKKFYKEDLARRKADLVAINECSTNKALVEFVLKYMGVHANISSAGVEFSHFTAMHNDFNGGMGSLMKEIVMFFCFDTNYQVEFEREDDGNENPKNPKEKDISVLKASFMKEMDKAEKPLFNVKKLFDKESIAKDVSDVFPACVPCVAGETSTPKKGDLTKFLKKASSEKLSAKKRNPRKT